MKTGERGYNFKPLKKVPLAVPYLHIIIPSRTLSTLWNINSDVDEHSRARQPTAAPANYTSTVSNNQRVRHQQYGHQEAPPLPRSTGVR